MSGRSCCPAATGRRLTLAGLRRLHAALPRCFPASRANPTRGALVETAGGSAPTAGHAAGATKMGARLESGANLPVPLRGYHYQNNKQIQDKRLKTRVNKRGAKRVLSRDALIKTAVVVFWKKPGRKQHFALLFRVLIASHGSEHHGGGSLNGCT